MRRTSSMNLPHPEANMAFHRPKIHSYKELQKASFTMYEAIPSSMSIANLAGPSEDPEIEKFLPMLTDYLRRKLYITRYNTKHLQPNDSQWRGYITFPVIVWRVCSCRGRRLCLGCVLLPSGHISGTLWVKQQHRYCVRVKDA